jgi:tripartite-type tricarboxylate transporter receptor subunit TctC
MTKMAKAITTKIKTTKSMTATVKHWSRRAALAALPAMMLAALGTPAQAKWPEKPVRIILPFGAGGVADVTARILADQLSKKFDQRVIIENMPGPGGINAAKAIISADPDGYTMGYVTNGTAISVAAFKSLPFDPVKQFEMVSSIATFDLVFCVNASSPYKTIGDFIKAAKASPGKINIGTIAVGGTQNLGAELFKSMADLPVQIIPYKKSPDIVVGLLRNDVQMQVDFPPAVRGAVADGKLRILAVSSPKRSEVLPDIPTVAEAGVPGYEVVSWNGLAAPKGTPKAVIDTMNKAIREVMADPAVKAQYIKVGVVPNTGTPEELMARLKADIVKWNAVIDKAGIPRK